MQAFFKYIKNRILKRLDALFYKMHVMILENYFNAL